MAPKDSCSKCRPMVDQLLKTLAEVELVSADSGLTLEMKKKFAIENLKRVVESYISAPKPKSTHVEEGGSKSHVCKNSPVEEKSQAHQQHEKSTICLEIEEGKGREEEEEASTSKSQNEIEKNIPQNLSMSSLATEPENEEVDKNLLELDMNRCVLVYCKICNKQFSEKTLARQHIQEAHLQRNTINEKPESESELESQKEQEEIPAQNEVDSVSCFTMTSLLPQQIDSISIQLDENEQVESPAQEKETNQAETVENNESVIRTSENGEMENGKIPIRSSLRCTRRRGGGQILYQCLQNRSMKKKFTDKKIHSVQLTSKSTSPSTSISTGVQLNKKREEPKRKSARSKAVDSAKRSEESSKPLEKSGKKKSSSKEVVQKQNPSPKAQKQQKGIFRNNLIPTPPKSNKKSKSGMYYCQWTKSYCRYTEIGMKSESKIALHEKRHVTRETKMELKGLPINHCKICFRSFTNQRYFKDHLKSHRTVYVEKIKVRNPFRNFSLEKATNVNVIITQLKNKT